jgi:hypothetical protein
MNAAHGIAPQNQSAIEQRDRDWLVTQIVDPRNRMPVCRFNHG